MIKYPAGHTSVNAVRKIEHRHRGMSLEDDINTTNEYYLETEKAVVHKKPTPIQIVHVNNENRSNAKITEAYFRTPSTTDYNGVYRGYPLDFEAKETTSKTIFTLNRIKPHQITHLKNVCKQKAVAFVLIRFTIYHETYYVEAEKIFKELQANKKSLSRTWMKENAYLVPFSLAAPVDYLRIVDQLYGKGE